MTYPVSTVQSAKISYAVFCLKKNYNVTFADTLSTQRIRKTTNSLEQILIGDMGVCCGIIPFPDDRGLLRPLRQMAIQATDTGIQSAIIKPADVQIVATEIHILNLGVRFHPVNASTVLAPEFFRVLNGLPVHALISFFVGPSLTGKIRADWIGMAIAHRFPSVLIVIDLFLSLLTY